MTDLILDGLIKARDQIARPGYFHKGQYFKNEEGRKGFDFPCCIFGAVAFAINKHPGTFDYGLGRDIIDILRSFVPKHIVHSSGQRGISLIEYSDRVATTQDDVVALFNRAIDERTK